MTRAAALAAAACLAALVCAAPAAATDVTVDELSDLAARAESDPAALDELREVTSVDGRPYPVAETIEGASGDELRERLAVLSGGSDEVADIDADEARTQAADVAGNAPELRPDDEPATAATDTGSGASDLELPLWAVLAIGGAILLVVVLVASRLARNRVSSIERAAGRAPREKGHPVRDLEREADAAEAAGDHAAAVRLRFQAGLLSLALAGRIDLRPHDTPRGIARRVGEKRLDALTGRFEEIVYGGREAGPEDAREAKEGWRAVVAGPGGGG